VSPSLLYSFGILSFLFLCCSEFSIQVVPFSCIKLLVFKFNLASLSMPTFTLELGVMIISSSSEDRGGYVVDMVD